MDTKLSVKETINFPQSILYRNSVTSPEQETGGMFDDLTFKYM